MTSKIIVNNIEADVGISSIRVLSPVALSSGLEGEVNINGTVSITGLTTFTGHVLPNANNLYDLGSTTKGWRNVYMNDLNLSNMNANANDVDGTQGSWTIQEGKDDLYIINRLNGKKYKIKLEEVS